MPALGVNTARSGNLWHVAVVSRAGYLRTAFPVLNSRVPYLLLRRKRSWGFSRQCSGLEQFSRPKPFAFNGCCVQSCKRQAPPLSIILSSETISPEIPYHKRLQTDPLYNFEVICLFLPQALHLRALRKLSAVSGM